MLDRRSPGLELKTPLIEMWELVLYLLKVANPSVISIFPMHSLVRFCEPMMPH